MTSSKTFALCFLASLAMAWNSCKKQELETPTTRVRGKWKLVKTATDDNNNGNIEESEKINVPSTIEDLITFNKDFTGVETTKSNGVESLPLNFTWSVAGDSIEVAYDFHSTIKYYLASVTSGNLTLQTKTQYGLAWYNYNKQ